MVRAPDVEKVRVPDPMGSNDLPLVLHISVQYSSALADLHFLAA